MANDRNSTIGGMWNATVNVTNQPAAPCDELWQFSIYPERKLWIRLVFGVVYTLIFTLGLTGNAATVFITARNRSLHNVQNFFIMNLSISALCVCCFSLPFSAIQSMFKRWYFGPVLCRAIPWAQAATMFVSTASLCAIAVDRYQLICHSTFRLFNGRSAFLTTLTIWVFSSIIPVPYAYNVEIVHFDRLCGEFCQETWESMAVKNTFTFTVLTLQFLLPFSVITFCYVAIFKELNRRAQARLYHLRKRQTTLALSAMGMRLIGARATLGRQGSQTSTESDLSSNTTDISSDQLSKQTLQNVTAIRSQRRHKRRNSRILIVQVLIFLATKLPGNVTAVYMDMNSQDNPYFDPFEVQTSTGNYTLMYVVSMTMHIISMLSTVANPVVYALINQGFRDTLIATFNNFRGAFLRAVCTEQYLSERQHAMHRTSIPVVSIQTEAGKTVRHVDEEIPFMSRPKQRNRPCTSQHVVSQNGVNSPVQLTKSSGCSSKNLLHREQALLESAHRPSDPKLLCAPSPDVTRRHTVSLRKYRTDQDAKTSSLEMDPPGVLAVINGGPVNPLQQSADELRKHLNVKRKSSSPLIGKNESPPRSHFKTVEKLTNVVVFEALV